MEYYNRLAAEAAYFAAQDDARRGYAGLAAELDAIADAIEREVTESVVTVDWLDRIRAVAAKLKE